MMLIATTGLLLLSWAPLPQDEGGELYSRRDADFARALTNDFGFTDLAETVLERSLKRNPSENGRAQLLLARCDVRKLASRRAGGLQERLDILASAGEAYAEFLRGNPPGTQEEDARRNMAEVTFQYGQTLQTLFITEPPSAEARTGFLKEADPIFQGGLESANELLAIYEDLEEGEEKVAKQRSLYFPSLFFRALIYYYWGLVSPPNSVDSREYLRRSIKELEGFAIKVGQGTVAGLRAFKYMGDAYLAQSNIEDAEIYYDYVIENHINDAEGMSQAEIDQRQDVAQQGYLGRMLMLQGLGRSQEALQLAETFQTWENDEGVFLSDDGHRMMLRYAEELTDIGNIPGAIDLVQRVERENERKNYMILEARNVLQKIIAAAPPDAEFDLSVLYAAAKGAYDSKNYPDSTRLFQLLISRMGSSRQAEEFGAQSYFYLGRAWLYQDRRLEAGVTFEEGYNLFPNNEDFANFNARGWLSIAEGFKNRVRNDQVLTTWYDDALNAVNASGEGNTPDAILWRAAVNDYNIAKESAKTAKGKEGSTPEGQEAVRALKKAIESFGRIEFGSIYYEKAIVNHGMCEYRQMPFDTAAGDRAFKVFNDYLEIYLNDPEKIPPDRAGRANRKDASAQADYYRGQVRIRQARAGRPDGWDEVLKLYEGYLDRHPDQASYGAATMKDRIDAYLSNGEIESGIQEYDALVASNLSKVWHQQAAFSLFNFFNRRAAAGEDPEQVKLDKKRAADYLHVNNELSPNPSWQNIYTEAKLRLELKEPSTAAQLLESMVRRFKDDAAFQRQQYYVEMDLVDALLAQDKTGQANEIVKRYLANPGTQNRMRVISSSVKVLAGYPLVREGRVTEVPGQGTTSDYEQAEGLLSKLTQLAVADSKYPNKFDNPAYWEARLQTAYLYFKRAEIDSTYNGKHRKLIDSLRRLAPDMGAAAAGEDVAQIFEWLSAR